MDSRDPRNNYKQRENLSRRRATRKRQEPLRQYVENDNPPARARQRNSRQHEYDNDLNSPTRMNRKKLIIALLVVAGLAAAIGIGEIISNAGKVEIVSVQHATLTAQQPYQNCQQVATTNYSRNHKNGTEGAVIGGVGGAVVGGLISHSLVGVGVGAVVGGVGGDLIQRSHQPDYVAHHGSTTQCETAYRPIQVPIGYQVGYLNDDAVTQITTQHQPQIGTKVKLTELEADQVTPLQQQQLVQQAISGSSVSPVTANQ